jgi:hypothetical protein
MNNGKLLRLTKAMMWNDLIGTMITTSIKLGEIDLRSDDWLNHE